jgi:hypothetical protein
MIIYLSLLVCIVGGILYMVCGNPPSPTSTTTKIAELGRLAFACGLIVFLFQISGAHPVTLLH